MGYSTSRYYYSNNSYISRAGLGAVALSVGHMEIAASRWKSLSLANIFAVVATRANSFEFAAWGFAGSTLCQLQLHHPCIFIQQYIHTISSILPFQRRKKEQ
jgi:hypothetical protein